MWVYRFDWVVRRVGEGSLVIQGNMGILMGLAGDYGWVSDHLLYMYGLWNVSVLRDWVVSRMDEETLVTQQYVGILKGLVGK